MSKFHVVIRTATGVTEYDAIAHSAQEVIEGVTEKEAFGITVRPL